MIKRVFIITFILSLSILSYGEELATIEPMTAMPTEKVAVKASEKIVDKTTEEQAPLLIATDKKNVDSGPTLASWPRAAASGMIIVLLLGVSYYYVSKYKFSNKINKSNLHIKVLSQHYLGPKKSLAVVHVAGESILLGITDTNISMIKSLSLIDDEVPAEMPKTFDESMTNSVQNVAYRSNSSKQPKETTVKPTNARELDEEFSFAGVTDTVSKKIKSMRSFS